MNTATERTYGPWHDVKLTWEPRWTGAAMHTDYAYYVGHPEECGWTREDPGACTFEDVLDDSDNEPGAGEFRARVYMDHYDIDGTDYTEDTLEWESVGGERSR